jgi:hypothetical protein
LCEHVIHINPNNDTQFVLQQCKQETASVLQQYKEAVATAHAQNSAGVKFFEEQSKVRDLNRYQILLQ